MRKDALGFLLVYLVVLIGVPANLVIQPLGAQGTPAGVIAAGAFLWWVLGRIAHPSGTAWRGSRPDTRSRRSLSLWSRRTSALR